MVTRFRYTTRGGDELELRDLKELEAHVAAGRVDDDTLLFDALTGDFGPARSHEAYRFVVDDLDGRLADGAPESPGGRAPGSRSGALPDLGVTLAEVEPGESTEAVVARLRREREQERGMPGWAASRRDRDRANPTLVAGDGPAVGEAAADVGQPLPADAPSGAEEPSSLEPSVLSTERPRFEAPRSVGGPLPAIEVPPCAGWDRSDGRDRRAPVWYRREPAAQLPATDRPLAGRSGRRARGLPGAGGPVRFGVLRPFRPLRVFGLVTIMLGLAYLGLGAQPGQADAAGPARASAVPLRSGGEAPSLDPVDALASSEGVAFHQMVDAMDSLAREHRVFDVPAVWLEAEYLADASTHPEVGAYWVRYLVFVRKLRREDASLFRRSFVNRLAALDVSPSVVSLRLAQAVERFEASQGLREATYDRMEDLATAGIEFHRLLVERDADLEYVPPDRVHTAVDPVLQIRTDDPELQERIYALLDRMFDDLEAIHGRTRWTRDGLNDGVLTGIRSTGTR